MKKEPVLYGMGEQAMEGGGTRSETQLPLDEFQAPVPSFFYPRGQARLLLSTAFDFVPLEGAVPSSHLSIILEHRLGCSCGARQLIPSHPRLQVRPPALTH